MSVVDIQDLTFVYPGNPEPVFEKMNLRLDTGWKLGLVGRNGRGKTTLMRILAGQLKPKGRILTPASFHYFPPSVRDASASGAQILLELHPGAQLWQLEREASLIELTPDVLERPFSTLSGGERAKLLIAGLFMDSGDDLPLIDEPTNHLDSAGRERVAAYLRCKRGFILSSHDRDFLDACVDHVLALNRDGTELVSGNFTVWKTGFDDRQNAERRENEKLRRDISRLSASAGKNSTWSDRTEASKRGAGDKGFVGHKAAKLMKRAKNIERRKTQAVEQKARLLKNYETAENLKMFPVKHPSDCLARAADLRITYLDGTVTGPYSFTLRQGDRLCVQGPNGSGKSTLLNALVSGADDCEGILELASGLRISWAPQDAGGLSGTLTDIAKQREIDETRFLTVLRKLGFERYLFERDASDLSQGQKKKVALAASLCEEAHLYVWDEPLNYLDIYARTQVETVIRTFEPTMIFVEHDRAFQRAVATDELLLT